MRMTKKEREAIREHRMAQLRERLAIVRKGTCPTCGTKLYRNLALSGWWQCGHYGTKGFQREDGPACSYQMFFDPTDSERVALFAEGN